MLAQVNRLLLLKVAVSVVAVQSARLQMHMLMQPTRRLQV